MFMSVLIDLLTTKEHILFRIVRTVCNTSICGSNGTCVDTELSPTGYTCTCNSNRTVFDGTTCVRAYFLF